MTRFDHGRAHSLARIVLLIALALSIPASAQPQRHRPLSPEEAAKIQARALFKAGKASYASGQYLEAAKLFSEGYELDPQPAFLINIAQSYRSAGKLEEAINSYRMFLSTSQDSPLRSQVEDLIREMEAQIKAKQPAMEPPAKEPPPSSTAASTRKDIFTTPGDETPPATAGRPFYKTWWFWTVVGVAVVGTTVGVGVWAGTREPDYVQEGGLGTVRW